MMHPENREPLDDFLPGLYIDRHEEVLLVNVQEFLDGFTHSPLGLDEIITEGEALTVLRSILPLIKEL